MLKWTYVYGYFLEESKDPVKKDFFEYQQANAEGVTERLARLLFDEVSKMKADELKNMTRVTRKVSCLRFSNLRGLTFGQYIENLSKSLSEGFDETITNNNNTTAPTAKAALKTSMGAKQVTKPAAAVKMAFRKK